MEGRCDLSALHCAVGLCHSGASHAFYAYRTVVRDRGEGRGESSGVAQFDSSSMPGSKLTSGVFVPVELWADCLASFACGGTKKHFFIKCPGKIMVFD